MDCLLAISPHLDDAAISAGARLTSLAAAGVHVTVITVFAGISSPPFSPAARELHAQWGVADADAMTHRRAEDRRAMACLGLHYEHKDFLDAIYRRQAGGSWLLSGGRPPWHRPDRPEPDLAADLAIAMRAAIEKVAPQLVLTCAAIGNHTDHVLTRNAVIQAVSGTRISLDLWEDLPYGLWASQIPRLPAEAVVGARITEPATDAVWDRKYRAIECYASQEGLLWGGRDFRPELDRHERSLDAHPSKRRTEAFWRIRRGPVERAPVQLAAAQPPHDHAMTRS